LLPVLLEKALPCQETFSICFLLILASGLTFNLNPSAVEFLWMIWVSFYTFRCKYGVFKYLLMKKYSFVQLCVINILVQKDFFLWIYFWPLYCFLLLYLSMQVPYSFNYYTLIIHLGILEEWWFLFRKTKQEQQQKNRKYFHSVNSSKVLTLWWECLVMMFDGSGYIHMISLWKVIHFCIMMCLFSFL
jgi:hypothetical protein